MSEGFGRTLGIALRSPSPEGERRRPGKRRGRKKAVDSPTDSRLPDLQAHCELTLVKRELPEQVKLLDAANRFVCWLDREKVRVALDRGEAEPLRSPKGKIHAIRWVSYARADDPRRTYRLRRRGYGDSHDHERDDNPEGVWTIDRVRSQDREIFIRVLTDCLGREAA